MSARIDASAKGLSAHGGSAKGLSGKVLPLPSVARSRQRSTSGPAAQGAAVLEAGALLALALI